MIYPFMRSVIYGVIWYQGINSYISRSFVHNFFIGIGEFNVSGNTYACKFAKMIQNWREMWNNRTNGSVDIQFPFGFVQVSSI